MRKKERIEYTTIGGQALMEGILMKGDSHYAIATRLNDGSISLKKWPLQSISEGREYLKLPFLRGIAILFDSLKRGMGAIEYSADQLGIDDEKPGRLEVFLSKFLGKELASNILEGISIVLVVIIAFVFFFFLPSLLSSWINEPFLRSFCEALLRILFFLIYILFISHFEELKRVFMYHGAEHKTISCYEHKEELTVENVRKYSIVHPRCGTSFLANLVIISSLFMSFFTFENLALRVIFRILMIPVFMGLTYELNLWTSRSSSFLSKILILPGQWIQKIATVKEPTDDMMECAIVAMKAVLPEDEVEEIEDF